MESQNKKTLSVLLTQINITEIHLPNQMDFFKKVIIAAEIY